MMNTQPIRESVHQPACILIVDDEASIRYFLSEELGEAGYRVLTAASGERALELLQESAIDLVLLDLKMQGIDGLEVMAYIERQPLPPSVIMLTAYASLDSAVQAMRYGGCDYLIKPCEHEELLASVARGLVKRRRVLRRQEIIRTIEEAARQLRVGPPPETVAGARTSPRFLQGRGLLLDSDLEVVTREGEAVSLTSTEFKILTCLMVYAGQTVTYSTLAEELYGDEGGWDRREARQALSTHLWRLRSKLDEAPDGQPYIVNVRGQGYKFVTQA